MRHCVTNCLPFGVHQVHAGLVVAHRLARCVEALVAGADTLDLPLLDLAQEIGKGDTVIAAMLKAALKHVEQGQQQDADNQPDDDIFAVIGHALHISL